MKEDLNEIIRPYKENYIRKMRKSVGHAPLMTTACGVIIENSKGEILLQETDETLRHVFFSRDTIPGEINEFDKAYIEDWKKNISKVIIS